MHVKTTGRAVSMPAGLAIGCGCSVLMTLMVAGVGAKMIDGGILQGTAFGYVSMASLFVSSMVGALVAASRIKRQKWMVSGISGLIYLLVLLSATALMFGGQYEGVGVTVLVIAAGAVIAAMITTGQGREKRNNRRRKVRHR